jgi:cold shock CspA family protein
LACVYLCPSRVSDSHVQQEKGEFVQGTVKWFSSEKGYGFVTSDKGEDHYFNAQGINGATLPSNGDSVQFDSKPSNKGPRAFNVKKSLKHPRKQTVLRMTESSVPVAVDRLPLELSPIEALWTTQFILFAEHVSKTLMTSGISSRGYTNSLKRNPLYL